MTTNPWKVAEYRRFLGRHAQTLHVEPPTESKEQLLGWLDEARAVLSDESNIFDLAGDLVRPGYVGPARNICRLHAWVKNEQGELVRRSFIREVKGTFDASALRPGDPTVFNWDSAFTLPDAGSTLHEMSAVGLKNSAREQCLSAFVKERLLLEQPKALRWTLLADWATDARLLLEHPLYAPLPAPLRSALDFVVNEGVFFRSAKSRREGNYWFPGLNGGLPFVPKGDAVHEATYLLHDVMHHLMPDLLFDGTDSDDHRRTYIAYRMMSEAISLVFADMVFVSSFAASPLAPKDYDFAKRRIFPLYQSLDARRGDLKWLAREVTRFVLRGEKGSLAADAAAWKPFEEKYTRFFVADFQWTRMNWKNLHGRSQMVRDWVQLVGAQTFRAQHLWFVSDVVARLGRGLALSELVDAVFELVWAERIAPALAFHAEGEQAARVEASTERGFRRWLTGQLAFFARYRPLLGLPELAHELAVRLRDGRPIAAAERASIRERFGAHVTSLAARGVISDDDALMFRDCFPLFDPFFLRDYDTAKQEFSSVAEASARAFS